MRAAAAGARSQGPSTCSTTRFRRADSGSRALPRSVGCCDAGETVASLRSLATTRGFGSRTRRRET
eukprot:1148956-Pyramimonas_sp.AAC.1